METVKKITNKRLFSFAEIVQGRDASVRVTDDGLLYAADLVMVVTGNNRDYACHVLRDLDNEIFNPLKFSERQLSTRGGPKTKLVSFNDAIQLIMVLPGKNAKETRSQFADIIHRYIAGDRTLITEIDANARLSSPIEKLARGVKRGYGDIEFILNAFDYQKKALEMRHKHDLRQLTVMVDDNVIEKTRENEILEKEIAEAIESIKTMEGDIKSLKKQHEECDLKILDHMEGVRILSRPFV
jgi:hypothetical protein